MPWGWDGGDLAQDATTIDTEAKYRLRHAAIDQRLGRYTESIDHCTRGIDSVGSECSLVRSALQAIAGLTCCYQGDAYNALSWAARGFEGLANLPADESRAAVEALLHRTMGNALLGLERPRPAIEAFQRGLTLRERLDDSLERSSALYDLGAAHSDAGEWDAARDFMDAAYREKTRLGDRWGLAYVHHGLARIVHAQGDSHGALAELESGIYVAQDVADPRLTRMLAALRLELRGSPNSGAVDEGPSDHALDRAMGLYADGEDRSFRELYEGLAPRLLAFARRRTRNVSRADDAVQQTFLQVHRARATFQRGAATLPWVFAILRRVLIDGHRRERRDDSQIRKIAAMDSPSGHPPDEDYSARELAGRLVRELDTLTPQQQQAFSLVRTSGLTFVEAAAALGTTSAAVKLRLHRATQSLRRVIDGEEDTG